MLAIEHFPTYIELRCPHGEMRVYGRPDPRHVASALANYQQSVCPTCQPGPEAEAHTLGQPAGLSVLPAHRRFSLGAYRIG
jgi:hypothetical protein